MGFKIDDSSFKRGMKNLQDRMTKRRIDALGAIGDEVLRLSQEVVPIDKGELQNSGKVELLGDSGLVGYNKTYAAYQHEGMRADGSHVVRNYTNPRSQRKFLENPIKLNSHIFRRVFAEMMAGGLR